jgi:hypothetical protein
VVGSGGFAGGRLTARLLLVMWYDEAENWIIYAWFAAIISAWVLSYARGYMTAAWVAPLTISAFCLGLYLGIENTAKGKFKLPVAVIAGQMGPILERLLRQWGS